MRAYRGRVILLAIIAATEIGLGLLAPWPLQLLLDNVFDNKPMHPVVATVVGRTNWLRGRPIDPPAVPSRTGRIGRSRPSSHALEAS